MDARYEFEVVELKPMWDEASFSHMVQIPSPEGPSSSIVYTWALKEFLYPYFGAYVYVLYPNMEYIWFLY